MDIKRARDILTAAGYTVVNNRASFSSSRRGIHGKPTYRVYRPGSSEPEVWGLRQVREFALDLRAAQINGYAI